MSKLQPILTAGLLLLCALAPAFAGEDKAEHHVDRDPARELYRRSLFAHGYIHGYEDGFRQGDFDLQTGHEARDPHQFKQFRDAKDGYQSRYGKCEEFRLAYRSGFAIGYTDAVSGREFRAVSAARHAALGLTDPPEVPPDNTFNRGFHQGYESGKVDGKVAGRDHASYHADSGVCAANQRPSGHSEDFCDGYARGYGMGYDDGYLTAGRDIDRNMTAQNRK